MINSHLLYQLSYRGMWSMLLIEKGKSSLRQKIPYPTRPKSDDPTGHATTATTQRFWHVGMVVAPGMDH